MEICLTKLLVFSSHFYYLFFLKVFIVYSKSQILIFFKKLGKGGTQLRDPLIKSQAYQPLHCHHKINNHACFILFQMVVLQKY